jgi:hypothetical protein
MWWKLQQLSPEGGSREALTSLDLKGRRVPFIQELLSYLAAFSQFAFV